MWPKVVGVAGHGTIPVGLSNTDTQISIDIRHLKELAHKQEADRKLAFNNKNDCGGT